MIATIWSLVTEGLKALGILLGLIHDQQQKQAGIDAQRAADEQAESDAMRRVDQVSAQGQTNEQTLKDLQSGNF